MFQNIPSLYFKIRRLDHKTSNYSILDDLGLSTIRSEEETISLRVKSVKRQKVEEELIYKPWV